MIEEPKNEGIAELLGLFESVEDRNQLEGYLRPYYDKWQLWKEENHEGLAELDKKFELLLLTSRLLKPQGIIIESSVKRKVLQPDKHGRFEELTRNIISAFEEQLHIAREIVDYFRKHFPKDMQSPFYLMQIQAYEYAIAAERSLLEYGKESTEAEIARINQEVANSIVSNVLKELDIKRF